MNRISVVGTGYVGLVSGACLSEFGNSVCCMDVDKSKIERLNKGEIPIYEPGLDVVVKKNMQAGRLKFVDNIAEAVANATTIFIAVGTPPKEDGSADLQYVLAAARSVAQNMDSYKIIVDKSTVPVGTGKLVRETVQAVLDERGVDIPFDVVSNPEFLREGAAVNDFMKPDRIVIGTESEKAKEIMLNIYRVLYINNYPMLFTDIETAELIKYAANAFLATKISFINELSVLCEKIGANVQDVAKGMGLDGRIGRYFLHAGPGYGGSCFPKDTHALLNIGKEWGVDLGIVDAVIKANDNQKARMVDKIKENMGDVKGKKICVLGLAFKPETDDIREAPAVTIIKGLYDLGAKICAFDPIAMENAKKLALPDMDIEYAADEYSAAKDADALVLVTEWNQFRSMDIKRLAENMKGDRFFDLRNVYQKKLIEKYGLRYYGVGK